MVTQFQSDLALCHNNIGLIQSATGRPAAALKSHEQARAIRERLARDHPESPDFASNLGGTLNNMAVIDLGGRQFDRAQTKLTQAVEWQRKALASNPNHPVYRQFLDNHLTNLITAAEGLGRADAANDARRQLAELAATDPVKAALDARLAAVLKGGQIPKNDGERIQLAFRAYEKALHSSSARLYAEALANEPKLADDREAQHRYNAACAAALASSGQGNQDSTLDEPAKAKLRRQARQWLQSELAAWRKVVEAGPAEANAVVATTLKHWETDGDLAAIRDEKELAKLPEEERAAVQQLWKDVEALKTKAAGRNAARPYSQMRPQRPTATPRISSPPPHPHPPPPPNPNPNPPPTPTDPPPTPTTNPLPPPPPQTPTPPQPKPKPPPPPPPPHHPPPPPHHPPHQPNLSAARCSCYRFPIPRS